jgi:hypothetical protein
MDRSAEYEPALEDGAGDLQHGPDPDSVAGTTEQPAPYKVAIAVAPTVGGAPLTRSQLQHPRVTPSELMVQFKEAARAMFHGAANEDDLVRLHTEHVYQASTTADQATHWNNFLRFLRETGSTLPASDVVVAGWIACDWPAITVGLLQL